MRQSLLFRTFTGLLLALLAGHQAVAQPRDYEAGIHYRELATPLPDADPDRYEVVELFWYGCPACYEFLPTIQLWEASFRSSDMTFTRMPVIWNRVMETHARAHVTAKALGLITPVNKSSWMVTPGFHNTLYDAINLHGQSLRNEEEVFVLFEREGISRDDVEKAWNSPEVNAEMRLLKGFSENNDIQGLPALVVNNRYIVTLNEHVKTTSEMIKVMNYIIVDIREQKRRQLDR